MRSNKTKRQNVRRRADIGSPSILLSELRKFTLQQQNCKDTFDNKGQSGKSDFGRGFIYANFLGCRFVLIKKTMHL